MGKMAEWSLLPTELLERISGHLKSSVDLLRFRSVCSSWRSAVPGAPSSISLPIPANGDSPAALGYLTEHTLFLITPLDSTTPRSWLVKIRSADESSSGGKHLLCPLSRYRLNPSFPRPLNLHDFRVFELGHEYVLRDNRACGSPSPRSSPDYPSGILKVVITWLDSGSHFLLLGLINLGVEGLALYNSADKEWTLLKDCPCMYTDVIAYNDKLYAVDSKGRTVRVGLNAELELIANASPVFDGQIKRLVGSRGQLLLVDLQLRTDYGIEGLWRGTKCHADWREEFRGYTDYLSGRVFRLVEESQSWVAVNSLDDQVLFLGEDSNFSASVADLSGCCGNCIFFENTFGIYEDTEDEAGLLLSRGIGVYELGSGSVGQLRRYPEYAKIFSPPPGWVSSTSLEEYNEKKDVFENNSGGKSWGDGGRSGWSGGAGWSDGGGNSNSDNKGGWGSEGSDRASWGEAGVDGSGWSGGGNSGGSGWGGGGSSDSVKKDSWGGGDTGGGSGWGGSSSGGSVKKDKVSGGNGGWGGGGSSNSDRKDSWGGGDTGGGGGWGGGGSGSYAKQDQSSGWGGGASSNSEKKDGWGGSSSGGW